MRPVAKIAVTDAPEAANDARITRPWSFIARIAVAVAAWALRRYSLLTDTPAPGSVEAADCLDEAARHLTPSTRTAKGGDQWHHD